MQPEERDRERLVASLCGAGAYPHAAERTEHIETHISDVFLAGEFAYKVKKPVNFGFCDFSTPELRRRYTERELELNQRLSHGVYLSIEPVRFDRSSGAFNIGGEGEEVEVALKMRRLDSADRLDRLLAQQTAGRADIERLAMALAEFHRDAPRAGEGFATHAAVSEIVLGNIDRVREHSAGVADPAALADIEGYARAFLKHRWRLFDERRRAGAPRMCHGDLHTGNVFLEKSAGGEAEIQVIDCIEFNDQLMFIDPAADIAFLSMDLKRRGHADLADALVGSYVTASGDTGVLPLLPFYESYRAMVRSLASSISAGQAPQDERGPYRDEAAAYLRLACETASGERPLTLIVMAGATGSGKSTVAEMVASQWGAVHLRTDVIRKELAGLPPLARTNSATREGIYSPEMSLRTYEEMVRRAAAALAEGRPVIMDGTHLRAEHRERSLAAARGAAARTVIIECRLDEKTALERIETRYRSGRSESEGRPEVYMAQAPQWEPVSAGEADSVIRLDTGQPVEPLRAALFGSIWGALLSERRRASQSGRAP
jgi:hypothetical protein